MARCKYPNTIVGGPGVEKSPPPLFINTTHGRFERELGRKTYTTPTSYLELIKLYLEMLGTQRESVSMNESRYRNGLQKLEETKVMVNELQVGPARTGPDCSSDPPRSRRFRAAACFFVR